MNKKQKIKIKLKGSLYWSLLTNEWLKPSQVRQMQNQGFVFEIVD